MKNRILIKSIAYYSVLLGFLVLIMWFSIVLTEPIQEGRREMFFHLVSEVLMAMLCVCSGFTLLRKRQQHLNIAAHAMVVYSVINAAGYYLERNGILMTALFFVLFLLSAIILLFHFSLLYSDFRHELPPA